MERRGDKVTHVPLSDRRQQLIDATIRTIGAHGLAAATTRRIAEEAGASLASLHYCFRTKDELIAAAWAERVERIVVAAEHAVVPGQSFREASHRIMEQVWEVFTADPGGQIAKYELMFHYSRNNPDRAGRWAFDRQTGRILRALESALVSCER
jgi:AcrR family transcriptional regulator